MEIFMVQTDFKQGYFAQNQTPETILSGVWLSKLWP